MSEHCPGEVQSIHVGTRTYESIKILGGRSMKRIFVLIAVLALLTTGAVSVLADPINVGGTFTTSSLSPINVGGTNSVALSKMPSHAKAYGLRGYEAEATLLLSPINVGGT